jgi:hypothetical protein
MTLHSISHMVVDPLTQMGTDIVAATQALSGHVKVAIVSNRAGHILFSDYLFGAELQPRPKNPHTMLRMR